MEDALEDIIETIPKTMEKFFTCSGQKVKPSPATVKTVVKKIRKGKIATLDQLKEKLADDFEVEVTCPASLNKALKILSLEEKPICYWRVVKKKGELINSFPDGVNGHAALLEKEGLQINFDRKTPVVIDFEESLVSSL